MTCFKDEELLNLFHGNVDEEIAQKMYSHIANCDRCQDAYVRITEKNMSNQTIDISSSVMNQIKKSPISKGKILAIYTVAAVCAFIIMTTGSIDKMMMFSHQLQNQATQWSQKIDHFNINQYWEGLTHGIQN